MEQGKMAMTTEETADQLQITKLTLLTWVKQGKVPAVKIGGRKYLYSRKKIQELIDGSKGE